jgi:putative nucleotidyltransferase with HDIG domain
MSDEALTGVSTAPAAEAAAAGAPPERAGRGSGDVIRGLSRVIRTSALYGVEHPVTVQTLNDVHSLVTGLLVERSALRLVIHEGMFFVDDVLLLEESLQLYSLLMELRAREMLVVELRHGVEAWEIGRLAELLNTGSGAVVKTGAAALLAQHEVRQIVVGGTVTAPGHTAPVRFDPRNAYRAALRAVEELNYQGSRDLPLALHKGRLIVASFVDIVARDDVALMGMTALRNHDEETCHHSVNVGILSLLIGFHLGLDRSLLSTLGLAALLHDIGKVRIPREVLTKPGRLTPEEQQVVRRHAVLGAHLLRNLSGQARLAMLAAFEHHANYDLSGYPAITTKRVPHLVSRVVQIADYFDAMTSARRPYRRALLPSEAIREIGRGIGTLYDPVLARVFIQVMGLYPVGSVVELDTGALGVVVRPGERDVARPVVRVLKDHLWETVPPYQVALETQPARRVLRVLDPDDVGISEADTR